MTAFEELTPKDQKTAFEAGRLRIITSGVGVGFAAYLGYAHLDPLHTIADERALHEKQMQPRIILLQSQQQALHDLPADTTFFFPFSNTDARYVQNGLSLAADVIPGAVMSPDDAIAVVQENINSMDLSSVPPPLDHQLVMGASMLFMIGAVGITAIKRARNWVGNWGVSSLPPADTGSEATPPLSPPQPE